MHAQHTRPTLLLVGLLLTVTAPGLWACDPCDEDHHKHDHEEWEEECDPDEAEPECTVWFQDGAYYSACGDGPVEEGRVGKAGGAGGAEKRREGGRKSGNGGGGGGGGSAREDGRICVPKHVEPSRPLIRPRGTVGR